MITPRSINTPALLGCARVNAKPQSRTCAKLSKAPQNWSPPKGFAVLHMMLPMMCPKYLPSKFRSNPTPMPTLPDCFILLSVFLAQTIHLDTC